MDEYIRQLRIFVREHKIIFEEDCPPPCLDALPVAFDEKLWNGTIDHVTVHADERVVFMFKDGKEIVTRL